MFLLEVQLPEFHESPPPHVISVSNVYYSYMALHSTSANKEEKYKMRYPEDQPMLNCLYLHETL